VGRHGHGPFNLMARFGLLYRFPPTKSSHVCDCLNIIHLYVYHYMTTCIRLSLYVCENYQNSKYMYIIYMCIKYHEFGDFFCLIGQWAARPTKHDRMLGRYGPYKPTKARLGPRMWLVGWHGTALYYDWANAGRAMTGSGQARPGRPFGHV
jgi:hypothetical protein